MAIERTILGLAVGTVAILATAATALAHAHLVRATPAAGGTVHAVPNEVVLRFNEKLEAVFSTVVVRDSDGAQVDRADAQVDKADRTVLRVSLQPLRPGVYKVEWRAMSADTHKINGDFKFTIGE